MSEKKGGGVSKTRRGDTTGKASKSAIEKIVRISKNKDLTNQSKVLDKKASAVESKLSLVSKSKVNSKDGAVTKKAVKDSAIKKASKALKSAKVATIAEAAKLKQEVSKVKKLASQKEAKLVKGAVAKVNSVKKVAKKGASLEEQVAKVASKTVSKIKSAGKNNLEAFSRLSAKVVRSTKKIAEDMHIIEDNQKKSARKELKVVKSAVNDSIKKVVGRKTTTKKGLVVRHRVKERLISPENLIKSGVLDAVSDVMSNTNYDMYREVAGSMFKYKVQGSNAKANHNLVVARITVIDSLFNTNIVTRRYYAIEDLLKVLNKDDKLVSEHFMKVMDNIDDKPKVLKDMKNLFNGVVGIQKDMRDSGYAYSFLSKYGFFLTEGRFPTCDSSIKGVMRNYFGINVVRNFKGIEHFHKFLEALKSFAQEYHIYTSGQMGNKVHVDYVKVDSLLWLFSKIESAAFLDILNKEQYISMCRQLGVDSHNTEMEKVMIDGKLEPASLKKVIKSYAEKVRGAKVVANNKKMEEAIMRKLMQRREDLDKVFLPAAFSSKKARASLIKIISFVLDSKIARRDKNAEIAKKGNIKKYASK